MSKYDALHDYLLQLKKDSWNADFLQIEHILNFSLPKSARYYPAWWANQKKGTQCNAWLDAGWMTSDLNLLNETILFSKESVSFVIKEKANSETSSLYSWNKKQEIKCSLRMEWQPIGKVILEKNRLSFPNADQVPALYLFRIRSKDNEAFYIGETVNVKRRFAHYRNPGSSQKTNIRINEILKKALQGGAEISVSIITGNAWVDKGYGKQELDLSSKVARCFLENAAILDGCTMGIDSLNKASL